MEQFYNVTNSLAKTCIRDEYSYWKTTVLSLQIYMIVSVLSPLAMWKGVHDEIQTEKSGIKQGNQLYCTVMSGMCSLVLGVGEQLSCWLEGWMKLRKLHNW